MEAWGCSLQRRGNAGEMGSTAALRRRTPRELRSGKGLWRPWSTSQMLRKSILRTGAGPSSEKGPDVFSVAPKGPWGGKYRDAGLGAA